MRRLVHTDKKMLKITLDTNILVSATISEGNEFRLLELARAKKIELILSPAIIKEYKEVISRPKFGFPKNDVDNLVSHIMSICKMVIPSITLYTITEDSADNRILECAYEGKVSYIVSGDQHLLRLRKFKGIKIVNTMGILTIISSKNKELSE